MVKIFVTIALLALSSNLHAEAGGPDYWQVTGIDAGDELNMRRGPSVQFGISHKLAHDTAKLLNLGCYPDFSIGEWEQLSAKERKLSSDMRWCRVMFKGQTGWIFARYLQED